MILQTGIMQFQFDYLDITDTLALMWLDNDGWDYKRFQYDVEQKFPTILEAYVSDYGAFVFTIEYDDFNKLDTGMLEDFCVEYVQLRFDERGM